MSGVIETWHLVWIVPVSVWVGFIACAVIGAWGELTSLLRKIGRKGK